MPERWRRRHAGAQRTEAHSRSLGSISAMTLPRWVRVRVRVRATRCYEPAKVGGSARTLTLTLAPPVPAPYPYPYP